MANKADVDHVLTWSRQPYSLRKGFKISRQSILPLDLRNADLRDLDLSYLNFADDDLREVDLRGSLLNHSNLSNANLQSAWIEGVNLDDATLISTYLRKSNLSAASMRNAQLFEADLQESVLDGAILENARAEGAQFRGCKLRNLRADRVDFSGAFFAKALLTNASLQGAKLVATTFVDSDLSGANLDDAWVYGTSVWDCVLDNSSQSNLLITKMCHPPITVDNLEIAQFIYLILNNQKIRQVIDTITSKVVLILGRFTEERKRVLDAIREELRRNNLTPILFDFDKPASKDITGTVETLARMARFIIADLTDPSSIPHELGTIVPFLRTTPVLPIRVVGSTGYSMFEDLRRSYKWVLDVYEYSDGDSLISNLPKVIAPADRMAEEFRRPR